MGNNRDMEEYELCVSFDQRGAVASSVFGYSPGFEAWEEFGMALIA